MSESSSAAATTTSRADDDPTDREPSHGATSPSAAQKRKRNRQMFNRKRGELLDVELTNLDVLIYAELSAIYYMEYFHPPPPNTFHSKLTNAKLLLFRPDHPRIRAIPPPLAQTCAVPRSTAQSTLHRRYIRREPAMPHHARPL